MQTQLLYPMIIYALYMMSLSFLLMLTNSRAVKTGEVSIKYFKTKSGTRPSESTEAVTRHFDNQFQMPILFLIGGTLHLWVDKINAYTLVFAWLFVFSRFIHSYIFLGKNNVIQRAKAFAAGILTMLAFWGQLLYFLFTS